ncbi:MAG: PLP-dependent cysteine synthase family protein [Treponema sp.]|nr:PLP-dependent cysteine synthase family protein [Treponema sp.]
MDANVQKKFNEIKNLIGNTPMIEITYRYKKKEERTLYFKLEFYNLTGSVKDRMALNVLLRAYESGAITKDHAIAETTSGNTGIAFCSLGAYLGHEVFIYMPDWMSEERKNMMYSFGAKVRLINREQGGFKGCLKAVEDLKAQNEFIFTPHQFENNDNTMAHFNKTGPEVAAQLKTFDKSCDAVIAGVGTGGTIMGLGNYLRSIDKNVKVYPLEPQSSPTLSTGYQVGKHRIQGISDEFIPPILKLQELDEIVAVDDGDAIIMAQKLSYNLGLCVGISSGANFIGAVKAQNMLGGNKTVVSIFSDDNKKYLSTDLLKEEPIKDGFLSTDIELLSYRTARA